MVPINRGFFTSAAVSLVLVAAASFIYLPSIADVPDLSVSPQVLGFVSVLVGVVLAATIQQLTGYFTETSRKPVKDIGRSSLTGPATVILSGISLGLESAVYAALLIGGAVYGAFLIGGGAALYAVALAGCGLLTTAGVIVAMDTFGPVSDNAQGIAEMSGDIDEEGARVLTDLDAVGNTTKAITKGIAIATAVLAATALFGSYNAQVGVALDEAGETLGDAFSLVNPNNVVGAVLGAAVVFFFSGLAISAVSRAAGRVVFEVREQFRTRPGIMDYTERPDYSAVVDICTKDSLRELATPGLLAVLAPVAVGFGLGHRPAGGLPGRRHRGRHADGGLPRQLRRRLGQREEDGRGRRLRRQGQRGARRHRHRRHRGRPVQGHRRPGDQPADQGDEPRRADHRARRRRRCRSATTPTPACAWPSRSPRCW